MYAPIPEVSFICLLTLLQLASWFTCKASSPKNKKREKKT